MTANEAVQWSMAFFMFTATIGGIVIFILWMCQLWKNNFWSRK